MIENKNRKAEHKSGLLLKEEKAILQKCLEIIRTMIIVVDNEEKVAFVNKKGCEILGYGEKEVLGKNWFTNFFPARIKDEVKSVFQRLIAGKTDGFEHFEGPVLTKLGEERIISWRSSILKNDENNIIGILNLGEDITERKRSVEQKKQYINDLTYLSETAMGFVELPPGADIYQHIAEHLKNLVGDSIVIVNSFDPESDLTCVRAIAGMGKLSKSALKILGRDPVGTTYKINEVARRQLLKGKYHKVPGKMYELSFGQMPKPICYALEKLFRIREIHSMGFTWKGELFGNVVIILRDGTELKNKNTIETFINQSAVGLQRRRAEGALRESEEQFRTFADNVPGVVIIYDVQSDGHRILRYISPGLSELLGEATAIKIGDDVDRFFELVHPEDIMALQKAADIAQASGQTLDHEYRVRSIDTGEYIWVRTTGVLSARENGVVRWQGILSDITERKKAEESLRKRLQFEQIISKISSDMISSFPEELDEIINKGLKDIAKFAGAVRSSIFIFSDNLTKVTNTHEWCAGPKDSQISLLQGIPAQKFGYYFKLLKRLKTVAISRLDDLPLEANGEREWIKEYGFRSLLFVPMIHEGELYGTIGFYGEIGEERDWPQEVIGQFNVLSDVFVTTLERKRSEKALIESEEKYKKLFETSPDAVILLDLDFKIIDCNKAAEKIGCIHRKEVIGKYFGKEILPLLGEEKEKYIDPFLRMLQGELETPFEVEITNKVGETHWLEIRLALLKRGDEIFALQIIGHDITELKRAVEERERAKTIGDIVDSMVDAVIVFDTDGICIFTNPQYAQMFGLEQKDFLDKFIMEIPGIEYQIPEEREKFMPLMREAIETGRAGPIDLVIVTKDGKEIPTSVAGGTINNADGKPTHIIAVARDITNRKKAEEALRESEEKFRNLSQKSPNMIFINKKGRIVYVNEKCVGDLGYKREEFYSPDFDFLDLIAPECMDLVKESYSRHERGEEVPPYECSLITKEKQRIEAIFTTKLINYDGERAIMGIVTDITERKKAEEALRESTRQWKTTFDTINAPICIQDVERRIIQCNKATTNHVGKPLKYVLDHDCCKLMHGVDEPIEDCPFMRAKESHQRETLVLQIEDRWFNVTVDPIIDAKGVFTGAVHMMEDNTESKLTEEQLKRSLEEREVLFKELKHRVKNNLQLLSSMIGMQIMRLDSDVALKKLQEIQSIIETIALIYSRVYEETSITGLDLNNFIEEIVNGLLRFKADEDLRVDYEIMGDKIRLNTDQAIPMALIANELVFNAVEHAFIGRDEGHISVSFREKDKSITMTIADNGVGMSKDIDITKTETLGLKLVKNLTEQLRGKLDIVVDRGTEFIIDVPKEEVE